MINVKLEAADCLRLSKFQDTVSTPENSETVKRDKTQTHGVWIVPIFAVSLVFWGSIIYALTV